MHKQLNKQLNHQPIQEKTRKHNLHFQQHKIKFQLSLQSRRKLNNDAINSNKSFNIHK